MLLLDQCLFAQCPNTDFTLPATACQNENIALANSTFGNNNYYWNFCGEDLKSAPSSSVLQNISQANQPFGIKDIFYNQQWYSFIVNRGSGNILRIQYGPDLLNSNPMVVDLGNPDDELTLPEDIEIIKVGNNWFGLVTQNLNSPTNEIMLVEFGTDLLNLNPTITNLGNFGILQKFRGIAVAIDDSDIIVALAKSDRTLTLINFRDSFYNFINPGDIIVTGNIFAGTIFSLDIYYQCNNWFVITPSNGNLNVARQGNDLFSVPISTSIYPFSQISSNPFDVDVIQDGENVYSIIGNISEPYVLVNMGDIINQDTPVLQDPSPETNGTFTAIDINLFEGSFQLHGINSSKDLSLVSYSSDCGASLEYSQDSIPPPVNYANSGVFPVTLVATNDSGAVGISKSLTITSSIAPDIAFTSQNNCITNPINFSSQNQSGDIQTYAWDFGDGSGISSQQDTVYTYASKGTYLVTLDVTSLNGCTNFYRDSIIIYSEPIPDFNFTAGTICNDNIIDFTNLTSGSPDSVISWNWDFNGEGNSTDKDPSFTFVSAGMKTVTLTPSLPGCAPSIQKVTNVQQVPIVNFMAVDICFGESITFENTTTGTDITGYEWDFGDGNNSMDPSPNHTYSLPGDYLVSLTVNNNIGCENILSKNISVNDIPVVSFTNDLGCAGTEVQFQDNSTSSNSLISTWYWDFGDPNSDTDTSTLQNPRYMYTQEGNYNVKLVTGTNFSCKDSTTIPIIINPTANVDFITTSACVGETTVFNDTSIPASGITITGYNWMIENDFFTGESVSKAFDTAGIYQVMLTLSLDNSCSISKSANIRIINPPQVDFIVANNCENQAVQFIDVSETFNEMVSSYFWDFDGLGNSDLADPTFVFPSGGDFQVTLNLTTGGECSRSLTKMVTINQQPFAQFMPTISKGAVPLSVTFNNTSTTSGSFLWEIDGVLVDSSSSPTIIFDQIGIYQVQLTALNASGCTDSETQTIEVVDPFLDVEVVSLTSVQSSNGYELVALLKNNGSLQVDDMTFTIDLGNQFPVSEQFSGQLLPFNQINYPLNITIPSSSISSLEYVCVSVLTNNQDFDEESLLNNEACLSINLHPTFLDPFPNPVKGRVNTSIILPEADDVIFIILNREGKIIRKEVFNEFSPGLNTISFNTDTYTNGIYLLQLIYRGQSDMKRIMIQN